MLGEGLLRSAGYTRQAVIPKLKDKLDEKFFSQIWGAVAAEVQLEAGKLYSGIPLDAIKAQWMLYRKYAEAVRWEHNADNVSNAIKLKVQLALQEAGILDSAGKINPKAIRIEEKALSEKNARIGFVDTVSMLSQTDNNMENWIKLKTIPVKLSTKRSVEVHYYYNINLNVINYSIDYKVKPLVSLFTKYHPRSSEDEEIISAVIGRKYP